MMGSVFSSLSPLRARLLNGVCRRDLPWTFMLGEHVCTLEVACAAAEDPPFAPACRLAVMTGDALWLADLGSLAPLDLHAAVADAPDGEAMYETLPAPLRQAVLESVFQPLLDRAAAWLGVTVRFMDVPEGMELAPEETGKPPVSSAEGADAGESLFLMLTVPSPAGPRPVPLRLTCSAAATLAFVVERLESLPVRHAPVLQVPVACSVEAGRLTLPLAALRNLESGDVLLPEAWHPETPWLRLPDDTILVCRVNQGAAQVVGLLSGFDDKENTMTQTDAAAVPSDASTTAPSPDVEARQELSEEGAPLKLDVDSLNVTVCFELERLSLSVGELASLAPGYTFALACDPSSPVTVRVGKTALASGRLVDINGVIGVQLTRLEAPARAVEPSCETEPDSAVSGDAPAES